MKLENKFTIFIIFLILFLSIGSISANEDSDSYSLGLSENGDIGLSDNGDTEDIALFDSISASDGNDDLKSSIEESASSDKLEDSSKTLDEIQSMVESANDGDTIYLSGNYTGSEKSVNISKSITIDGNGSTTIDGKAAMSNNLFYINLNDGNVTIKGITFVNANYLAICAISANSISIEKCAFKNNNAAVYIESANSTLIRNCVFNKNQDSFIGAGGAAIFVQSVKSRILNCRFVNNSVDLYIDSSYSCGQGGAIYSNCNYSEINNCSFTSNRAVEYGGAIYEVSNLSKILNCVFKNNTVRFFQEDFYNYGPGGAIYCTSKRSAIVNCSFTSNRGSHGGAVYYNGKNCTITNCVFNKNIATKGGAIYKPSKTLAQKQQLRISRSNFTDNKASLGRDVFGGVCSNCIFNYVKLTANNRTIKKSAKHFVLSVKLTKGKTLLKGQRVKVIFRGRTYIAKTNYKGIARVTIKRAVIKKLKAGKKYAVKFTYSKYSIKRVVKVRH
ncbi:right-handed parallel beta-helix repeat-containing protein [uncultured Methanobrevibacter sp.]|uniref:right-handed parallel beta-helix repeat-containing protein n=1 Tax=uncultured Methanobrevibacter sp. TaxID=253161 RepID=UPI0025F9204E|nr:right-handed parallel beta-helix repeat-containing protein [uncultured Methanobrevibacter sp.]